MSLRVWLPLTGDLHNQGISDTTVNSNSLTVDANGKIGQCYRFTSSNNSNITLTPALWDNNTDEMSFCCWIKMASFSAATLFCNRSETASTGFAAWIMNASQLYFDTGERWTINLSTGLSFVANQWYHICFTYSKSKNIKAVYINGSRTAGTAGTAPTKATATATYIGTTQTGTGTPLNGWMNDVRLYDHCLSSAEVSEIARGLILHYKLDNSINLTNNNVNTWTNFSIGQYYTTIWEMPITSFVEATGAKNGDQFTFSIDINTISGQKPLKARVQQYKSSSDRPTVLSTEVIAASSSGRSSVTFALNTDYTTLQLLITNHNTSITTTTTEQWKCMKLEWGNKATPWCQTYNNNIVEDSSGYNHNGTIIGNLISTTDTKRYIVATKWNSSEPTTNNNTGLCYIQTPLTLTTPSQMTVTWWGKPESGYGNSTSHAVFCTSNNETAPTDYNSTAFHHRDSGFDIYPSDGSGVKRLNFSYIKNEWHHYAVTYDGTTARTYQDGIEKSNVTIGAGKTLASFSQLYIGFSKAGGVWRKTLGSYSDFRIYCTALLDTEIKQLYNVGIKIDKFGNMHPYEVQENNDMMINAKFVNNSATSVSYDKKTDTYTIVSPVGTSSWGYGVRLADTPALMVPYGATYRWTAEVWTPIALNINTDYNNTAGGTDVNWAGNDNDATGTRLASIIAIPANKWTRIYRGASNTNNGNTNHLPIRDYSSLGLVTNGQSNPVTWKIRHLQWYIADIEFKPQMKSTGIFEASHFTETEEDLNKPAQISKKMFSVNATQFIER